MTWITGLPGAEDGVVATRCNTVAELLAALEHTKPRWRAGHIELGFNSRLIAYQCGRSWGGSYQDPTTCVEQRFTTKTTLAEWLKEYAS